VSAWQPDQWTAFVSLLQRGFASKEPFTEADAIAYEVLLDGVEPEACVRALRELVQEGQALRPRPGEIAARARRDPSRPTFDEAYRLIFGRGGILAARPENRRYEDLLDDETGEMIRSAVEVKHRAERAAVRQAAEAVHPLVGQFVVRQGIDHLRSLRLDDPEYGGLRRRELREAWDAHAAAFDEREVAAIAAGGDVRQGLRQMDPLAALGLPEAAAALPRGGTP